jgi:hypothetical protein
MIDNHLDRALEARLEAALARWLDNVQQRHGCSRRAAANMVLRLLLIAASEGGTVPASST